ncbi:hypothetical protein [Methanohalobium sp.]|uniref:hypothetical protein n=1 Tax=Methanohalobium sp. TaxID=2837493 RepID=UPI0025CEC5EE|nr:hypothetical protein [Methanohalobium sp.]
MAGTSALMTIDSVVKGLQYYTGRGERDYMKLLGLVGRGIREMKKMGDPRAIERTSENLSNLTNGVMPYPEDALKIVNIFYNEGNRLFSIPERSDIVFKDTYDFPLPYYKNVESVKEINDEYARNFATPGGVCKYYYTDDTEGRRIIFDKTADEDIFIHYIGTGIDDSMAQDTLIPVTYQSPLEYFVLWKLSSLEKRKDDAMYFKSEYNMELKKMKYFSLPSMEQIKTAIYSTYSQAPIR